MKALVAYYSRTGNTKNLAIKIAKILKADTDEIIDTKNRSGPIGFLTGGRDAMIKKETEIETKKNPEKYDLIIVGTPVWAGTLTPAVRTYLKAHKFKKVAFFCTFGGSLGKTFEEMVSLSKKPVSVLGLKAGELKSETSGQRIINFCKKIS